MTYHFRPATREHAKLLIGLCGPSGSGKTLSSLKLAKGMGEKVVFIDTEGGRACQYADDYSFLHAALEPPFHPDRYREIVDDAAKERPDVLVIDSMSHIWEGPGGILEIVDRAKQGSGNDFGVWAGPKQAHQKMVNRLLQLPCHAILCFRAKEKSGLAPDPQKPGKKVVVNLGWHPICESGITYELTVNCLLSSEKKGVPVIDGFDFGKLPYNMEHLLPTDRQISEETGKAFADWSKGVNKGIKASLPAATADVVVELGDEKITAPNNTTAAKALAERIKTSTPDNVDALMSANMGWITGLPSKLLQRLEQVADDAKKKVAA